MIPTTRRLVVIVPLIMLVSHLSAAEPGVRFAIAIHGGAGAEPAKLSAAEQAEYKNSLAAALDAGRRVLAGGGTSLDAVEHVIRLLEDDPKFNAGRGAVLNSAGGHELDASIMDGRDRSCGAVAGVKTVKNPISLARLVMTKTRHVLLAGDGADRFAGEMGVDRAEQKYFRTERRVKQWQQAQREANGGAAKEKAKSSSRDQAGRYLGTVGCVALDRHGNLAAGTSTGGLTNKMYGRVGDSPIVGAGTYADNATCAVSCTGIGEHFIRHAIAYDVSALMAYKGWSVEKAARHVIQEKLKAGQGGLIAVGRDGRIALEFNTAGMFRAAADSTGRTVVRIGR